MNTLHRSKEENYYCTTHTNTIHGLTWLLRSKKCLDLNATSRMSFSAAEDYCEKKIPFSYRVLISNYCYNIFKPSIFLIVLSLYHKKAHILHRNELQALISTFSSRSNSGDGLDIIALYSNLGSEFSLWLNNNDFSACSNRDEAPVFIYNQDRCRKVI